MVKYSRAKPLYFKKLYFSPTIFLKVVVENPDILKINVLFHKNFLYMCYFNNLFFEQC